MNCDKTMEAAVEQEEREEGNAAEEDAELDLDSLILANLDAVAKDNVFDEDGTPIPFLSLFADQKTIVGLLSCFTTSANLVIL